MGVTRKHSSRTTGVDVGVIDDLVPVGKLLTFVGLIESNVFPWYYNKNTYGVGLEDTASQSGFTHVFVHEGQVNSDFWPHAKVFVDAFASAINAVNWKPLRVQANLVPQLKETHGGVPHTDGQQHLVRPGHQWVTGIVYLNDADGDTMFYDGDVICERHSPFANRCVWFDGSVFHSGSVPQSVSRRLVLNINLDVYSWK